MESRVFFNPAIPFLKPKTSDRTIAYNKSAAPHRWPSTYLKSYPAAKEKIIRQSNYNLGVNPLLIHNKKRSFDNYGFKLFVDLCIKGSDGVEELKTSL